MSCANCGHSKIEHAMGGVCGVIQRQHFCPCNSYREASPERRAAPPVERPKLALVHSAPALSPARVTAPRLEPLAPLRQLRAEGLSAAPRRSAAAAAPRAAPTPSVEQREHEEVRDTVTLCKTIAAALRKRSGKPWSVTRGRGTAAGWITIQSPPGRRGEYGYMTEADQIELAKLLGLPGVHQQGVSIAAANDYRREYLQRARTGTATVKGTPYWD